MLVVDLQGEEVDPLAELHQGVRVFVFVTSVCPISNRYAPTLQELHRQLEARGAEIVLVYPDPDDDAARIEAHRAEYGLSMPVLRDPGHALVAWSGARVTPEAVVVTRGSGEPRVRYRGRIDDRAVQFGSFRAQARHRDLAEAVEALLEGESPSVSSTEAIGCYISDLR